MDQASSIMDKDMVGSIRKTYDDCFLACMQIAKDTRNIWVALVAQNCAIAIAHKKEKLNVGT